jgi:hypothetical protein
MNLSRDAVTKPDEQAGVIDIRLKFLFPSLKASPSSIGISGYKP